MCWQCDEACLNCPPALLLNWLCGCRAGWLAGWVQVMQQGAEQKVYTMVDVLRAGHLRPALKAELLAEAKAGSAMRVQQ